MFDLVNHKPLPSKLRPINASIFQLAETNLPGEYAVAVTADRSYKPDQEFFIDYNKKSNFELFSNYGFVLENNALDNSVHIVVETPEDLNCDRWEKNIRLQDT